ncbi:hypothetical protein [Undibacterium sp.]|uniref:phage tail tube protein n=1 Tax=Undibacterium sp. TaxID=1914977 RepID=UPI002730C4F2|nr:hypothetical protein [Undibacterium sp.]MDP1980475.1 hypothetical protein [Undibacterium sp.]
MTQYYLGKGKVFEAERDANGRPKALRWMGDVSSAKLSFKTTKVDHKESYSGLNTKVKSVTTAQEATFDLTMHEINTGNLSSGVSGKVTKLVAGSVTGEVLTGSLVAGDRVALKYPKVSAVAITDSAGTPATVSPTKYKVDPNFGSIDFLDVTGFQQPFKAAYSHGELESVSLLTAQQTEKYIRYEGINLGEGGAPIVVELYKVKPEPFKDLALITDKFADLSISAEVLRDATKPADDEIGQFGRIIQVAPA